MTMAVLPLRSTRTARHGHGTPREPAAPGGTRTPGAERSRGEAQVDPAVEGDRHRRGSAAPGRGTDRDGGGSAPPPRGTGGRGKPAGPSRVGRVWCGPWRPPPGGTRVGAPPMTGLAVGSRAGKDRQRSSHPPARRGQAEGLGVATGRTSRKRTARRRPAHAAHGRRPRRRRDGVLRAGSPDSPGALAARRGRALSRTIPPPAVPLGFPQPARCRPHVSTSPI